MKRKLLGRLPSPPSVAVQILEMYSQPDIELEDLTRVISVDPALTARVVKYANSASFTRRHAATSLKQAVMVLGVGSVKLIALSFSLAESRNSEADEGSFPYDDFWNASLATAACAQKLYAAIGQDEETGFLLGLLMNVGQLAMVCEKPIGYQELLGNSKLNAPCLLQRELDEFGESRFQQTDAVLEAMNFPTSICEMMDILNSANEGDCDNSGAQALILANQMSYLILEPSRDVQTVRSFNRELSELTSLADNETELLYEQALASYVELASILAYESPDKKSLREIEMEAKNSIIEASLAVQLNNMNVTNENRELKSIAFYDTLTGLGNRRQYESMLNAELERCSRMHRTLSLVIIDIDHFKKINDTFGHAAGDAVLEQVASRMKRHLRSYDFLFRIGGEEFALILPDTNLEICRTVSERLRKCIAEEPFEFDGHAIPITVSLGGTMFDTHPSVSQDKLFKVADCNLYLAKKSGRNQSVIQNCHSRIADDRVATSMQV